MSYKKEFFVFDGTKPRKTIIRSYKHDDFDDLIRVQKESFPPPFPSELWWNETQLANHVELFPEGALCIEVDDHICGSMTGLLVNYEPSDPDHSWEDITNNGYIRNHNPDGNTLYVVDICVSPAYRKLGLGKWLMFSMYDVVVHKHLKRLLGGGRVPSYHKFSDKLSIEEYVNEVIKGTIQDPVMTFLLRCGRTPVKAVENYLEDEESLNHAVLMEWKNPFGN
ncbi:N-acetyltransferase [Bacillus sp. HMF5848]|uniref:GNAT family N-acetyltransferase n=1 Tax=Bacillus sp. HMF5848 TaxID=2495421 RepID=UPI000F776E79|nr:GNAT family N-acetyltransferase [Bacillus sp. HMF5848]RSK26822.1 N-acetyltransferase [Bacillus sp. HMF5848]